MRKLNERFMHYRMDNADGIKVWLDNGEWIPSPWTPTCPTSASPPKPQTTTAAS